MTPQQPTESFSYNDTTSVESTDPAEVDLADLIESIGKVSFAALPAGFSQVTACSSSLPPRDVVDSVLQTYLHRFAMPFLSRTSLLGHCDSTYAETSDNLYSVFLIGTIIATTAVAVVPEPLSSSLQLYHFSIQRLSITLRTKAPDPFRELEAVLTLASFARAVTPDAISSVGVTTSLLPDLRMLAGLGIRISVDHGLHPCAQSPREKALFDAAYALDVEAALLFHLPIGLPEATVHV
ncbi:hypothetical protein P154DRAFT_578259 [Amniculicola lignicola CBS 123094]|uniref:Transcription factor domain-containing protein n=1 Tax=Amniculicola lignicola CBS 123094 TaxID=1392246 RepID=A0A6A5W7R4_9PLEO|nr:hypothetical protein P154DRAFT_578259 [Amniculicola lignicola CBS 123094]